MQKSLPNLRGKVFSIQFQGSFFTWAFVVLFPSEKAGIQLHDPPTLFQDIGGLNEFNKKSQMEH